MKKIIVFYSSLVSAATIFVSLLALAGGRVQVTAAFIFVALICAIVSLAVTAADLS